jgi:hypothetical protein
VSALWESAGPQRPAACQKLLRDQDAEGSPLGSSPEGSTWINERARCGSGRRSRRRVLLLRGGRRSSSSSESEPVVVDEEDGDDDDDDDEVAVSESSESESVLPLVSLPPPSVLDAEPARRRCSKTPRPRFFKRGI